MEVTGAKVVCSEEAPEEAVGEASVDGTSSSMDSMATTPSSAHNRRGRVGMCGSAGRASRMHGPGEPAGCALQPTSKPRLQGGCAAHEQAGRQVAHPQTPRTRPPQPCHPRCRSSPPPAGQRAECATGQRSVLAATKGQSTSPAAAVPPQPSPALPCPALPIAPAHLGAGIEADALQLRRLLLHANQGAGDHARNLSQGQPSGGARLEQRGAHLQHAQGLDAQGGHLWEGEEGWLRAQWVRQSGG